MLVASLSQQSLDARQVRDQTGRDTEVTIAGRHPRHVKIHRPQEDRMGSDQRQRLSMGCEDTDDIDDRSAAPLHL